MAFNEVLSQISPTLVKIGGSVTPTGGTDDILTSGNSVKFTPKIDMIKLRQHSSSFTKRVGIPAARRWQVALQFYMQGSGGGGTVGVNGFAGIDALLQAGGMARATTAGTITYTPMPISSLGTAFAATIWNEQDGLLHKTYNAVGNPVFEGVPTDGLKVTWTGQGDYEAPTQASISGFTGGTDRSEAFLGILGTITPSGGSGYTPVVSRVTFDRGIRIAEMPDSNASTGIKKSFIVDGNPTLTLVIAADSDNSANLTYNKLHTDWTGKVVHSVVFTQGTAVGSRCKYTLSQSQISDLSRTEGDGYHLINLSYDITNTTDDTDFSIAIF